MVSRFCTSASQPLKFYLDTISQPCRALEILLKITNVPYTPVQLNLLKGEHRTEQYSQINPFKKVPVIDDNGFVLTESIAIFRYICRQHDIENKWYPKDSRKQAAVDEFLEWQHIGLRLHLIRYTGTVFLRPITTGKPPNENFMKAQLPKVTAAIDELNNVWLKNKKFIAGDSISFADLLAACEVDELKVTDYNPEEGRPVLKEWLGRVRNETNPYYDQAHARLLAFAKKRPSS